LRSAGRKLVFGGVLVAGMTAYVAYLGASSGWQYYLTPDQCLADSAELAGRRFRVSGKIVPGSLSISPDGSQASFQLLGTAANLPVACGGPLPDGLAEGREVVVEGRLDNAGVFQADSALTRCASKYKARAAADPPTP
jgi:cytochrome c-type biogenesis protein CcmE